jgi:hypothetical protein
LEVCGDGIDNDCNGAIDEGCETDSDTTDTGEQSDTGEISDTADPIDTGSARGAEDSGTGADDTQSPYEIVGEGCDCSHVNRRPTLFWLSLIPLFVWNRRQRL